MTKPFAREDFAAGGGFSTGLRLALGDLVEAVGIEYDQAAVDTARANGHKRWLVDVTSDAVRSYPWPPIWLYHASPSCQSFSMGGKGEGRKHIGSMIEALQKVAYGISPADALAAVADDALDGRTELSLEPMVVIRDHRPRYISFEQVPPVLPLWEAYAEILRSWGYSVWTGLLTSEMYGVPQTRKRAVLMARNAEATERLGEVAPPTPTHSRYHNREPRRLDEGVLPWVSMAEALGRTETLRSNYGTGGDSAARGERPAPAPTITSKIDRNKWIPEAPNGGDASWVDGRPSPTIVGSFHPDIVAAPGYRKAGDGPRQSQPGSVRVTPEEASILQSFPAETKEFDVDAMTRDEFCQVILKEGHVLVDPDGGKVFVTRGPGGVALPAPRECVGSNCNGYLVGSFKAGEARKQIRLHRLIWIATNGPIPEGMTVDHINNDKTDNRLANLQLLSAPDNARKAHADGLCPPNGKIPDGAKEEIVYLSRSEKYLTYEMIGELYGITKHRVSQIVRQAPGYVWCGSKSKQFEQIGNAYPPLMAAAVVRALVGLDTAQGDH